MNNILKILRAIRQAGKLFFQRFFFNYLIFTKNAFLNAKEKRIKLKESAAQTQAMNMVYRKLLNFQLLIRISIIKRSSAIVNNLRHETRKIEPQRRRVFSAIENILIILLCVSAFLR